MYKIHSSDSGERLLILSTHIITDIEAMTTNCVLIQHGQVLWNGTPSAPQSDAATFESLHLRYQVSQAIRRGNQA